MIRGVKKPLFGAVASEGKQSARWPTRPTKDTTRDWGFQHGIPKGVYRCQNNPTRCARLST